jgi:hypothetical protein
MIRFHLIPLVLAGLLGAPLASAGDPALAEALFQEGVELLDRGAFDEACPKLAESFRQDPATGALFALALCQERAGRTASAWASYAEIVARSRQEGRDDRLEAARERLAALEPRLSRLTVRLGPEVTALPGLEVKRNGIPMGSGAFGMAAPVDPGEHQIEITAPGRRPWERKVTLGPEADAVVVELEELELEAAAGGAPVPADDESAASGIPWRTVGYVVAGVGALGLGASGAFALRARRLDNRSKGPGLCDANDECTSLGLERRDAALRSAHWATATVITGGVLAAAGVTLVVLGGPGGALDVTPAVGVDGAGLNLSGWF